MGSVNTQDIAKPWIETPLVESAALSKAAGCRIFLKLENLQPSGSFKSRGIGNLMLSHIQKHPPNTPLHFYSSSGGNAGLACVTAATKLGYPSSVIVPMSTKPAMIAKIRAAGAKDVIQTGASWVEADAHLREEVLKNDSNGIYVPPFDHPEIWNGNETMVGEMIKQMDYATPDAVVCSIGGGGLFCGIVQGLEKVYGDRVPVLAMETRGAESLYTAVRAKELVTLPAITSFATSLGARRVAQQAFDYGMKSNVTCAVLDDAEAAMGCWRFADDERFLVEPACGVSVAVCYDGRLKKLLPKLTPESRVVVVVCGGSNVTLEALSEWRREFGTKGEKMATNDPIVASTHSVP